MPEYVPPCEMHTDEDFEFSAQIVEVNDETWEVWIETRMNKRCERCFLLENCLASFYAIMEQWFELEKEWLSEIVRN